MRYATLQAAGRELAAALAHWRGTPGLIVLGIARGGVPAAVEVACAVDAPLDVVIRRGLVQCTGTESSQAVSVAGTMIVDTPLDARTADAALSAFVADRVQALGDFAAICRGGRVPLSIAGKTVLLVDNGIRTGATMRVAIDAVRTLAPARIIAASPVGQRESRELLHALADEVVCLHWPAGSFGHVGMWYAALDVPDERKIARMLETRAQVKTASYS